MARWSSISWDLGDGTTLTGPSGRHAYAVPGTYRVALTVRDDSGVANGVGEDGFEVVVNAPPIAEAGRGPPGRDRRGDQLRCRCLDRSGRRSGAVSVGLRRRRDRRWPSGPVRLSQLGHLPGHPNGPRQFGHRHQHRFRSVDGRGQRAAGRRGGRGSAGHFQRGPFRRYRVDRPRWRDRQLRMGLRRRRQRDRCDPGPRVPEARQISRAAHGHRRFRDLCAAARATVCRSRSMRRRSPMPAPIWSAPRGRSCPSPPLARSIPTATSREYLWQFKDGATATGPRVSYAFDQPGVYHVRLAVRDDTNQDKAVDYDEAKVVINAPPVARAGHDVLAAPGEAVTFDAMSSFDPDGRIVTYRWDFSDQPEPTFGQQVARAYPAPGVYTAQLTVTDDSGAINAVDQDEIEIRINHAPVAEAGPDIVVGQSTITFDGSGSADADGDPLTYVWDFGDGSPAAGRRACLPHLRRGRHLPRGAHGRRRHRAVERQRPRLADGDHQPGAGRGCRRQQGGVRRRRRGVRRQRVQRPGRWSLALSLGFRRRHERRAGQSDQDLRRRGPSIR